MSTFKELLRSTYKSQDTEENIDVYFTRPIGLLFALFFKKIGWTPNAVTILSYFLGFFAAWMFLYDDIQHNICGVLLLMTANFLDSADGQLARMTGKTSLLGRILDGFATEFWFICIYLALTWRLWDVNIPFTNTPWRLWFLLLCCLAGFGAHNFQCRIADYYRNIHLFFLKGKQGAELDSYETQNKIYQQQLRERNWSGIFFYYNYSKYCHRQEQSTPCFQQLRKCLTEKYGDMGNAPQTFRDEFCKESRPLMKYTNIISYNWRAIILYIGCLISQPWISPVFELTILMAIALYLKHSHENLCKRLVNKLNNAPTTGTIRGLIFDYGGTIDTRGEHWSKVIWRGYQRYNIPVTWQQFWEAYVATEKKLGEGGMILPTDTFRTTLRKKISLQLQTLKADVDNIDRMTEQLTESIYSETLEVVEESRNVLQRISNKYRCPMVLVSNFYGNIHTVLREFNIDGFFAEVIESAEVGIRKPDPRIWQMGIQALQRLSPTPLSPQDITIVGDSLEKDINPAKSLGCNTILITTGLKNNIKI